MADAQTISVLLQARDNASAAIGRVAESGNKLASGFMRHRKTIATASTAIGAAIVGIATVAVKSSMDQQIGIRQLDTALKTVGTSYLAQKDAIEKVIEAQQRKTNYGDEEQRLILLKLVGVLKDEQKALMALPAILDAAAFSGKAAGSVVETLSKFLAGLANNSEATGVKVDALATFEERLAAVTAVVAGQAEAAADPLIQLKNRMGDVAQVLGDILLPIINAMLPKIEFFARKTIEWAEDNATLAKFILGSAAAIGTFAFVAGPLLYLLPALIHGFIALNAAAFPISGTVLAVAAGIGAIVLVAKNWEKIQAFVNKHMKELMVFLPGLGLAIVGIVKAGEGMIAFFKNSEFYVMKLRVAVMSAMITLRKLELATKSLNPAWKEGKKDLEQLIHSMERHKMGMEHWFEMHAETQAAAANASEDSKNVQIEAGNQVKTMLEDLGLENEQLGGTVTQLAATIERGTGRMVYAQQQQILWVQAAGGAWLRVASEVQNASEDEAEFVETATERIKRSLQERENTMLTSLEKTRAEEERVQTAILDEWNKTTETLEAQYAKLALSFDETLQRWNASASTNEMVIDRWAQVMGISTDDVMAQMLEMRVDTSSTHDVLDAFALKTGESFLDWRERVVKALGDVSSEVEKTVATFERITGMASPLKGIELFSKDADVSLKEKLRGTMFDQTVREELKKFDAGANFAQYAEAKAEASGVHDPFQPRVIGNASVSASMTRMQASNIATQAMNAGRDPFSDVMAAVEKSNFDQVANIVKSGHISASEAVAKGHISESAAIERGLIKSKATGGFAGGLTLVGERGPEIVSLPGGSFVHPSGSGPGGVVNQFHFHGAVYGVEDLKEAVVEAVRDHAISGGFSGVFAEA